MMTQIRRLRPFSILLLLFLFLPSKGQGQTRPALTGHGELRPRMESRDPGEEHLTSMRTRVALDVAMDPGLRLFFQLQDVRNWGEETGERDRSADAVDFHQAFLEADDSPGIGGLIRAGRQEVTLAESRLMAAPDWGQGGQTFDGARWIRPLGAGRMEFTYLQIRESSSAAHFDDAGFWGAWYTRPLGTLGSMDLLAVHDKSSGEMGSNQSTVGGVWKGDRGPFSLRVQGMRQFGEREGVDVGAYMVAGAGTWSAKEDRASVTLWYDHLSGDDDPTDGQVGVFTTLYGARNRFYGRADYFTDIPTHTEGLGLQDAVLKLAYRPTTLLSMNLDLHAFRTAKQGGESSRRLGEEMDAWVRYRYGEYMTLQAGYSFTQAGPVMEAMGRLYGNGHFGYMMTSVQF